MKWAAWGWMGVVLVWSGVARAQECADAPSEWIFCDDFEDAADTDGNLGLWDDQGLHPSNLVLETDPAVVHGGARALRVTAHKGQDTGGGPAKWFLPGYDEIYVRFWVRFAPDYNYTHHLVNVGANEMSNQWSSFGTAGCRPNGANFFTTSIEPFSEFGNQPVPGAWGFYSYSVDMSCDPGNSCANYADPQAICDGCAGKGSPCDNGLECCWGDNNISSPPAISERGSWVCVEGRVAANTGGQPNGSQTLWVDDQQVGSWEGILWRTDDALKINSFGLWHYVTDGVYAEGQTEQTIWFDDVVISQAKIGCGPMGNPATGAGTGSASGPSATSGAGAGSGSSGAGGANAEGADADGGCGCSTPGRPARGDWLALGLLGLVAWRRRQSTVPRSR
ncbi:MAG: MYXO-CTERM sorting domain-containing protein [Polyangiaceae bacterium]